MSVVWSTEKRQALRSRLPSVIELIDHRDPAPTFYQHPGRPKGIKETRKRKPRPFVGNSIFSASTVATILCRRRNGALVSVLVDAADLPILAGITWCVVTDEAHRCLYAIGYSPKLMRQVKMHQLLLDAPKIDHKNGRGTDNRRCNLRPATNGQNRANSHTPIINGLGYRGVEPCGDKFRARIGHDGRLVRIGVFDTPEQAARAYDEKARELHGEFAGLNFPDEVIA